MKLHIDIADDSPPLLDLLASESSLSRQAIKQSMDKGALWLGRGKHTRRLRRVKTSLRSGDSLYFYYDERILAQEVSPATLVADETAYSIWYKPYGMHCQGSKWGDHCTINRNVEKQTGRNTFLVHRLDRAASGLIIIAHGKQVASSFSSLFRDRLIDKSYHAIVHGSFPTEPACITYDSPIDDKAATSHARLLQANPELGQSLLQVDIETGRKHQIRRHLADAGYPIVGDRLYGVPGDLDNLQLCATALAFTCPKSGLNKSYALDATQYLKFPPHNHTETEPHHD